MASIRISREHTLGVAKAKKAVDKVAKKIKERFDINAEWDKHTLKFARPGVTGEIVVSADEVKVSADISFLLLPIKGAIEEEIRRFLEKEFS